MRVLLLYLFFLILALAFFGCKPEVPTHSPVALSWESGHPERKVWSEACLKSVSEHLSRLDKAKDIASFHAKYSGATDGVKANIWCELFSALAKYESSWNPKSASVDVGDASKRDTYSICLLQLSVVDQQWVEPRSKYSYAELLEPANCLDLGVRIMARQIDKAGLVVLPNASRYRYWAILLDGNKYQKIDQVRAMVRALPL